MLKNWCYLLILLTPRLMAAAPVDIQPECKNEAFEVNGQIYPILQSYYSFYGDETLNALDWIESLKSIESCTAVVTKAESRYKRLQYFIQEVQKFPDPYKNYFEKRLAKTNSTNDQLVKVKIIQQEIDQLVKGTGIAVSEACSIIYGQWSWAASQYSSTFSNRMNSDLAQCKVAPLKILPLSNPSSKNQTRFDPKK